MAISVADNFSYQGSKPLDARTKFSTVSEMVSYSQSSLYDGCIAYVVDQKKYYSFDSSNEIDDTLSKWREFKGGGGGGLTVDTVTIIQQPTTTSYIEGDNLDLTGISVTATAGSLNGNVTSDITTVPSTEDILLPSMTSVSVNYYGSSDIYNITVVPLTLTITTLPTNTNYITGEALDLSGIVVTGTANGTSFDVTSECTFVPADGTILSEGNTAIQVNYKNKTQTFNVSASNPQSIEITKLPNVTTYGIGGALDLTGIEITATSGQVEREIASLCSFSPADGTVFEELGTYTVTASYMGLSDTFDIVVDAVRTMSVKLNRNDSEPATRGTYADDAVGQTAGSDTFDEFFGFYPVLMQNGIEVGKLDKNDYSKFEDGTDAPITTEGYDVMVYFPRRGYKLSKDATYDIISVTKDEGKDGYCYYPFEYKGDHCDGIYISAYECCRLHEQIYSLSGQTTCTPNNSGKTIAQLKASLQSRGTGFEIMGFYQFTYMIAMLIIKYRGQNPRIVLGKGVTEKSDGAVTTTGLTDTFGMFYGEDTGLVPIKAFGLENLWGNYTTIIDGIKSIKVDNKFYLYTSVENDYDNSESYAVLPNATSASGTSEGGPVAFIIGDNESGFVRGLGSGSTTIDKYLCYSAYAMPNEGYGAITGWWNGGAPSAYATFQGGNDISNKTDKKSIRSCQFKVS